MPDDELMPIGAFARRSGLTSSALRFYADTGLLPPAETDPVSGYRYYGPGQLARAVALRRLREVGMPLAGVEAVLGAEAGEAARLLDEHVARIVDQAAAVREKAAVLRSALGKEEALPLGAVKGPVLADAVEQVLTAAAYEPGTPALAGLRVEVDAEALTLTATDRYRLATRTLVPAEGPARTWAGTVDGAELRAAVGGIRRCPAVRLEALSHGIRFGLGGRGDRYCRLVPEDFPDHRLVLSSLGGATTRVTASKELLLRALEEQPGADAVLRVGGHGLTVGTVDDAGPRLAVPATVTGRALRVRFEVTTLHPAVSAAIGPDVLLDLRGHDRPVTVRSADRGDLTTLAMPAAPAGTAT
ncbi:MerR family transcriptional regulator [Streptomyces sp. CS62]